MNDRPLTTVEAAKIANRSESTIKWHCEKGNIPGAYKHGVSVKSSWLIPRAGLTAYLSSKKRRNR